MWDFWYILVFVGSLFGDHPRGNASHTHNVYEIPNFLSKLWSNSQIWTSCNWCHIHLKMNKISQGGTFFSCIFSNMFDFLPFSASFCEYWLLMHGFTRAKFHSIPFPASLDILKMWNWIHIHAGEYLSKNFKCFVKTFLQNFSQITKFMPHQL